MAVCAQTPSARDIIERLSGAVPVMQEEAPTRSLSAKLLPDPNTSLCEKRSAPAGGEGSGETRTLYVEKAPALDLDIAFDHNAVTLRPAGKKLLDTLALALQDKSLATASFVIAGHTNRIGDADHNNKLSCARALAARDYLRDKRHIASARLIPMGFGFSRLKPGIDPAADEHRRVEIRKAAD